MKRKWLLAAALPVLISPLLTHAATIILNGKRVSVSAFEINQKSNGTVEIITDSSVSLAEGEPVPTPEPEPNPEPEPTPEPTPTPGSCGSTPSNVVVGAGINWASPGGRETVGEGKSYEKWKGSMVWSQSFKTTSGNSYGGYVNVFETTGGEGITRKVWISQCPGGAPLESRCSRQGTGLITVPWLQRAYAGACELAPNEDYYLNVQNVAGCTSTRTCELYRSIPTNGRIN